MKGRLRQSAFGWPLTSSEKFDIVYRLTRQVTRLLTNKPGRIWCGAGSPKTLQTPANPIRFCLGEPQQSSGAVISRVRTRHHDVFSRDSRQSYYFGIDLSAGFSCSSFPLLDSWRMELPAARAAGFEAPVALRDLRVRICGSNGRAASPVSAMRKPERTI